MDEIQKDFWARFQEIMDIKSGTILGMFTLQMFAMIWCVYFKVAGQNEIPESIRWVYGMVMSGVTFNGVVKVVKGN